MRRAVLLYLLLCGCLIASWQSFAQMPMTGAGVPLKSGAAPPAGYTGPGDVVSGAIAWWGLRAYNGAWASGQNKIANICTPSDASCADVKSDTSGNLNLGASGLGCNNSTTVCTIKTFYDQSGNTNDVTQTTIANRATLVINCIGSLPCAQAAGSASYSAGSMGTVAQPYTFSAVGIAPTHNTFAQYMGGNANLMEWTSANSVAAWTPADVITATATDNIWHAFQAIFNGTSSNMNVDGTDNTGTLVVVSLSGANTLFTGGNGSLTGNMNEAGIWAIGFSSGQNTSMSSNQHSYWGF